jgi:hypothetical protein
MPKPGNAFTKPEEPQDKGPDVDTFDLHSWIRGTGLVTRSVAVCGMPQLMGHIEALKDDLERVQAAEFDDDRPLAKTQATRLAEELEKARAQMIASMVTFTFRALRAGEFEEIKAGSADDTDEVGSDLDYQVWARQCIKPAGVAAEDLKLLHRGDPDQDVEGLGSYFLQTIGRVANQANSGSGVDVPFSSASSALTAGSSKS